MFDWVLSAPLHRGLILKNRMKKVENKTMLKRYSPISNDWVAESHKRNRKMFINIRTIF